MIPPVFREILTPLDTEYRLKKKLAREEQRTPSRRASGERCQESRDREHDRPDTENAYRIPSPPHPFSLPVTFEEKQALMKEFGPSA